MEQKVIVYDPALCTGHMDYEAMVNGRNVGQCLKQMGDQFPNVKDWLFEKNGSLSSLVEVYLNKEDLHRKGSKAVKTGDEIFVQMMLSFY